VRRVEGTGNDVRGGEGSERKKGGWGGGGVGGERRRGGGGACEVQQLLLLLTMVTRGQTPGSTQVSQQAANGRGATHLPSLLHQASADASSAAAACSSVPPTSLEQAAAAARGHRRVRRVKNA